MLSSVYIVSPTDVFVETAIASCSWCIKEYCECIMRKNDTRESCEGTFLHHDDDEIFHFNNTRLFIEEEILPFVYAKNTASRVSVSSTIPPWKSTLLIFVVVFCVTFSVFLVFRPTLPSFSKTGDKKRFFTAKKKRKLRTSFEIQVPSTTFKNDFKPALITSHSRVSLESDLTVKPSTIACADEPGFTRVTYKKSSWASWC